MGHFPAGISDSLLIESWKQILNEAILKEYRTFWTSKTKHRSAAERIVIITFHLELMV
jgi:hypothetical protein